MSAKETVRDLLEKLPEEATLLQIAQEIEFIEGVRGALREADEGQFLSGQDLSEDVRRWTSSR